MSENRAENREVTHMSSLSSLSTMGNLVDKENGKGASKILLPDNVVRATYPALKSEQDNLKFFDSTDSTFANHESSQAFDSEKVILNAFLNHVRNSKPLPLKNWSALQHYIYFIYRHVISLKPCNSGEMFPSIITRKIRELIESLLQEDFAQLCIRLVSLIREYAIIARGHFNSFQFQKVSSYLVSLMLYYSAFCSAASKLAPLIPEFDFLIMERFNVNWLFLNRSIFYHYVYMSPCVQTKIPAFVKLKEENKPAHKALFESYSCFTEDMLLLAARWTTLRMRISNMSRRRAQSNPVKYLLSDWKTFEEYKKILTTNYWIIRTKQAIQIQDMLELDANLLSLMGDMTHISDFLIDSQGNCMCEDCLAAEFKNNSASTSTSSINLSQPSSSNSRLIICYMCQEPVVLDTLVSHIVTKHYDATYQRPARVYLTSHQKRFCSKKIKVGEMNSSKEMFPFEELFENAELKESILKIVGNCSQQVTNHKSFKFSRNDVCLNKSLLNKTTALEPILKTANEAPKMQNGLQFETFSSGESDYYSDVKVAQNDQSESRFRVKQVKGQDVSVNIKRSCAQLENVNGSSENAVYGGGAFKKPQSQKITNTADTKLTELFKNSNNEKFCTAPVKSAETSCLGHTCSHKYKQEDEILTEIKKHQHLCHDACDHHKDSRKCDCAYCEVFGSTMQVHPQKTNETRDRLRSRLNQRKEKVGEIANKNSLKGSSVASKLNVSEKSVNNVSSNSDAKFIPQVLSKSYGKQDGAPPRVPEVFHPMPPPSKAISILSTDQKRKSDISEQRAARGEIIELLNYIEGNKSVDKAALAQKKAAKKERQRLKKVQERERLESEKKQKEAEEKLKEEERFKAEMIAKQLAEKQKCKEELKKYKKKGKSYEEDVSKKSTDKKPDLIEETIPAIVTIKRVVEDENSPPTVTITLKGSTPESDKLLYTLVNGHNNKDRTGVFSNDSCKNKCDEKITANQNAEKEGTKRKKNKKKDESQIRVSTKEVKVTIAVDKNNLTKKEKKKTEKCCIHKHLDATEGLQKKTQNTSLETKGELPFSMLRLPPGITITKIEGPPANKNFKSTNDSSISNSKVASSKSGVIVVDTEKLMQQSATKGITNKSKKKSKKKKIERILDDSTAVSTANETVASNCGTTMVTLKNPIFHSLRHSINKPTSKSAEAAASSLFPSNQQASIFKNENGMVTIRSPRLQNPFDNGSPISNFLSDLKPMFGPEVASTPFVPVCRTNAFLDNGKSFDAREILSGLPGIEITKVDKSSPKTVDIKKSSLQPAEVSIIPTTANNNSEKFNFDKDDWTYESVFTPRDEGEDMDADERELEAFKRFCQQSVPPERKEKVAYLNVKDIVLKKKKDISYS